MSSEQLIVYPDGTDKPGYGFRVANGFVSRVVSAVAGENLGDADEVARILNDYFARGGNLSVHSNGEAA